MTSLEGSVKRCPNCQVPVDAQARFCPRCGVAVDGAYSGDVIEDITS